jgi:hypothetical protein
MPHQYQRNQGEVDCQIPNALGQLIVAPWFCILGSGEVVLQAGESAREPEYVASLYLDADYSPDVPAEPMPGWFYELLNGPPQQFHALGQAARRLDNPAAYAEVEQYGRHHERWCELVTQRRSLDEQLHLEDQCLDGIRECMEAWGLPAKVAHLKGRRDIHQEFEWGPQRPASRRNARTVPRNNRRGPIGTGPGVPV